MLCAGGELKGEKPPQLMGNPNKLRFEAIAGRRLVVTGIWGSPLTWEIKQAHWRADSPTPGGQGCALHSLPTRGSSWTLGSSHPARLSPLLFQGTGHM